MVPQPVERYPPCASVFHVHLHTPAGKVQFHHRQPETMHPRSSVQRMAQDSIGLLWFGTEDGLNRFDGSHRTMLRHEPADSTSIPDNYIWRLLTIRSFHGETNRTNRGFMASSVG
jgi:hypothetical protein